MSLIEILKLLNDLKNLLLINLVTNPPLNKYFNSLNDNEFLLTPAQIDFSILVPSLSK